MRGYLEVKMTLIEKIKLLFQIKKPVEDILDSAKEAKKNNKWFHFSVLLIGTIVTTLASLGGLLPPLVQLGIVTTLQCVYNILRGADKADNQEIKGTLLTTEFWTSALSEIQKALVAAHAGGLNPEWMTAATALSGAALAFGQNLAARAPLEEKKTESPIK